MCSEAASVSLKIGPPFKSVISSPSISNVAVITLPFGPGPASP